jgi:Smg protein
MKENVLDVLIYLFENCMFDEDEEEYEPDQESLAHELSQAGFDHGTIDRAFEWLENLAQLCERRFDARPPKRGALRHYLACETARIGVEARGFLLKLEQCGVLDSSAREMVINQLMALGVDSIDMDQLKWVVLMVLGNTTEGEGVSELTESLVLDGLHACAH